VLTEKIRIIILWEKGFFNNLKERKKIKTERAGDEVITEKSPGDHFVVEGLLQQF